MGLANKEYLNSQVKTIRHEVRDGMNTAERIGKALADLIDSIDSSIISDETSINSLKERYEEIYTAFNNAVNGVNSKLKVIDGYIADEAHTRQSEDEALGKMIRDEVNRAIAAEELLRDDTIRLDADLSEVDAKVEILKGKIGRPGGIAPLGSDGTIASRYIPGAMDDVKAFSGCVNSSIFEENGVKLYDSTEDTSATANAFVVYDTHRNTFLFKEYAGGGTYDFYLSWGDAELWKGADGPHDDKVYVDRTTNKTYRWAEDYGLVVIGTDLALGETAYTAYPGNLGAQLARGLSDEVASRTDADELLQKQIFEHRREVHYLPDNFATEKALFTAAGTYTISTKPIKPGALLLGCVDECWGVYQYVYFDDEVEISAQSEEAVQAVAAAAPTIAPPAVKYDANIANPENWVRLATIEEVNAALDALNIYNFGTLNLDFTSDNWFTIISSDDICPQADGIFAAWEAGKKIVGRFVVTKRVQKGMSSSMVTQPFDSYTIDYGGEDSHTHNPSIRFHCVSVDTSDSNIRVRSVRVYFSKYNEGEGFKYMYGASSMSQIDIPSSLNFNDWCNRLTTLETKAPTVEITDDDIVALLPSVEAGISTLELDEEQTVAINAVNAAPVNEKFEQFRAQLARELERGRKRMQFNNSENITDNGIEQ